MMTKSATSFIWAVAASLLAASMLSTQHAALADTCLTEPNGQNGQGGHWYYRIDRVNQRKCWWHVKKLQIDGQQTVSPGAPLSSEPKEQPALSSWSSWLTTVWSRLTSTERSQESTKSESLKIQTAPTAVLTTDDIVPKQQSIGRQSHLNRARGTELEQKSAPRPLVQRAYQQTDPPIGQVDRDSLFQEFLRWRDRQTNTPEKARSVAPEGR
jgi:hypothetical protein